MEVVNEKGKKFISISMKVYIIDGSYLVLCEGVWRLWRECGKFKISYAI